MLCMSILLRRVKQIQSFVRFVSTNLLLFANKAIIDNHGMPLILLLSLIQTVTRYVLLVNMGTLF